MWLLSLISHLSCASGWRVGWAIGPSCIAFAIKNIHTKVTDSAPAPFQEAALTALTSPREYYKSLRRVRDFLQRTNNLEANIVDPDQ